MAFGSSSSNVTSDVPFPLPYNAALAIVSSSLSVIGALALIATYFLWKSNRTISRFIVTCIAVSDFLTAFGYIVMSSYLLWVQSWMDELGRAFTLHDILYNENFNTLRILCKAQSFVTTTSSSWSFWWTSILAIHLYLIMVHQQWNLAKRLVWVYIVIATVVPLLYTIPAMATGWLGVGCFSATATWCFIGIPNNVLTANFTCANPGTVYKVLEAVEGKMWEVLAFLIILVLYLTIWCTIVKIRARRNPERHTLLYGDIKTVSRVVDRKILFIPVVFLFIRSWSMLRYLLSFSTDYQIWTLEGGKGLSHFLIAMESIFDGSQGWTNALLFLVLSKKVVDFMTRAYSSVTHACRPCKVTQQPREGRDSQVSNPVLYESIDIPSATHGQGRVTLNTSR